MPRVAVRAVAGDVPPLLVARNTFLDIYVPVDVSAPKRPSSAPPPLRREIVEDQDERETTARATVELGKEEGARVSQMSKPAPAATQDSLQPKGQGSAASRSGSCAQVPSGHGSKSVPEVGGAADDGATRGAPTPHSEPTSKGLPPQHGHKVPWPVREQKLRGTDRDVVSHMFRIFGKQFKMVIRPTGGGSFKKADGKGTLELKCLDEPGDTTPEVTFHMTFRISVGRDEARQEPPRGPFTHNFARHSIFGLPPGDAEWNFREAVDASTQTFVICLEVLTGDT